MLHSPEEMQYDQAVQPVLGLYLSETLDGKACANRRSFKKIYPKRIGKKVPANQAGDEFKE
jgi:hypothetical protein